MNAKGGLPLQNWLLPSQVFFGIFLFKIKILLYEFLEHLPYFLVQMQIFVSYPTVECKMNRLYGKISLGCPFGVQY